MKKKQMLIRVTEKNMIKTIKTSNHYNLDEKRIISNDF